MHSEKDQLSAEIGPVDGVAVEIVPTLIIGAVGDICDYCYAEQDTTVAAHIVGPLAGPDEKQLSGTFHRGCIAAAVREMAAVAASQIDIITIELGLYGDDYTNELRAVRDGDEAMRRFNEGI